MTFRTATVRECPWACGPPKVMKTRRAASVQSIICTASSTERRVLRQCRATLFSFELFSELGELLLQTLQFAP